jgi:hypothetical protein
VEKGAPPFTVRLSIASARTVAAACSSSAVRAAAKSLKLQGKLLSADDADEADAKVRLSLAA